MFRLLHNVCTCNLIRKWNSNSVLTTLKRSLSGNKSSYILEKNVLFNLERNYQTKKYSVLINFPLKTRNIRSLGTVFFRNKSEHQNSLQFKHKTLLTYLTGVAIFAVGFSYAAVPLYRLYCQATGYGGTTKKADVGDDILEMERVEDRLLTIRFEAGTGRTLQWKFKPQQKEVKVAPGETALAFYTAENLTDKPIIGISTYNVIPFDAGQYFNKIQCFCFEEQQLNPNEEVDMPVFFYIDPEFDEDPKMAKIDEIILSYTFFESSDGQAPVNVPHVAKES